MRTWNGSFCDTGKVNFQRAFALGPTLDSNFAKWEQFIIICKQSNLITKKNLVKLRIVKLLIYKNKSGIEKIKFNWELLRNRKKNLKAKFT